MSNLLHHIADRVANRPLLIHPGRIADLAAAISATDLTPDASRFTGAARQGQPYRITEGGLAVISVVGSLINRGAFVGSVWGVASYEGLAFQLESAARDPKVKSIVLDIESPGGEAIGAFETAALVRRTNAEKPVHALVAGMACSAAFAIASGCKSITTTESGVSGSIGVVMLHVDASRAIDQAGVSPTLIFAGQHKTDGNAFGPLSKEVKADLQAEVDRFYQMFVDAVAAGRGARLTAKAARATEAKTYIGRAAVSAGLADDIGSFNDLIASLEKSPGAARVVTSYQASTPSITGASKLSDTERYLARIEGARAERERIKNILGLPEAITNLLGARKLAFETDKTVTEAKAALSQAAVDMWAETVAKVNAEQAGRKWTR